MEDENVVAARLPGVSLTRPAAPSMGVERVEATGTSDPPSHPKRKDGMIERGLGTSLAFEGALGSDCGGKSDVTMREDGCTPWLYADISRDDDEGARSPKGFAETGTTLPTLTETLSDVGTEEDGSWEGKVVRGSVLCEMS